jgi:hypothetical protein
MPIDATQPVFQPPAGAPVQASWGQAVAEVVIQHFATVAERDLKWTNPPIGSVCTTNDTNVLWFRRSSGWFVITPRTYDQQKAWSTAT